MLTREFYEGFQRAEFDRWDPIVHPDVEIYSPGAWGTLKGLDALKGFAREFVVSLNARIDLVDEFDGGDRSFITICSYWKHVRPFFGLAPTGREGTSIETFMFRITDGKIRRFDVADNTLDLAIYLWERGFAQTHNVRPDALVAGVVPE